MIASLYESNVLGPVECLNRFIFHFGAPIASQRLASVSDLMHADLAQFEKLQDTVSGYLDGNSSSGANPM